MKKKAVREKARPPKFGSTIVKQKKDGDNPAPSTENKTEAPIEEVKVVEVSPEKLDEKVPAEPETQVNEENQGNNTSNAEQSPSKPSKPKVHIFTHGLPFFYAHKWVYEDPSSSSGSTLNSAFKKD
jgi:hypothetical protein